MMLALFEPCLNRPGQVGQIISTSCVIMPEAGSAYSLVFYDVDNHGNLCLIVCKMFAIIALFTVP
jgi:hypothetical protein